MPIPYEILIRGNADGTLSGCHVIDVHGGDARPIKPTDLESVAPAINADAIAQIAEKQAALDAKNQVVNQAKAGILSAIDNPQLDPEATVAAIVEIITTAELPPAEKRRAELEAEIAAKQAELDAL
jgi:hypothetical protein